MGPLPRSLHFFPKQRHQHGKVRSQICTLATGDCRQPDSGLGAFYIRGKPLSFFFSPFISLLLPSGILQVASEGSSKNTGSRQKCSYTLKHTLGSNHTLLFFKQRCDSKFIYRGDPRFFFVKNTKFQETVFE